MIFYAGFSGVRFYLQHQGASLGLVLELCTLPLIVLLMGLVAGIKAGKSTGYTLIALLCVPWAWWEYCFWSLVSESRALESALPDGEVADFSVAGGALMMLAPALVMTVLPICWPSAC